MAVSIPPMSIPPKRLLDTQISILYKKIQAIFPELKSVKLVFEDSETLFGSYNKKTYTIMLNSEAYFDIDHYMLTLCHEIAHVLDKRLNRLINIGDIDSDMWLKLYDDHDHTFYELYGSVVKKIESCRLFNFTILPKLHDRYSKKTLCDCEEHQSMAYESRVGIS